MSEEMNPEAWGNAENVPTLSLAEMENLIEKYNTAWDEYDKKKKVASEAHDKFQEVEHAIIKALQEARKTSYAGEKAHISLAVSKTITTPKTAEDKKAFFQYVADASGDDFSWSLMSVNSAQLNKFIKDAEIPPGETIPGLGEPSERVVLRFKAK